jgi:hypothetical protein
MRSRCWNEQERSGTMPSGAAVVATPASAASSGGSSTPTPTAGTSWRRLARSARAGPSGKPRPNCASGSFVSSGSATAALRPHPRHLRRALGRRARRGPWAQALDTRGLPGDRRATPDAGARRAQTGGRRRRRARALRRTQEAGRASAAERSCRPRFPSRSSSGAGSHSFSPRTSAAVRSTGRISQGSQSASPSRLSNLSSRRR